MDGVPLNGNGIRLDGIRGMDAAARSTGKVLLKLQGKIILRSGAEACACGGGRRKIRAARRFGEIFLEVRDVWR